MKPMPLLVACALALLTSPLCANDNKDQDKLVGTWTIVAAEKAGARAPDTETKAGKLVFADGKFSGMVFQHELAGSYTTDATKSPCQITLSHDNGTKLTGIYERDGDDLKICISHSDEAPTEFATKEGDKSVLLVLKREKP
jgi:uncharacterized protein (TIGR03067 family)